MLVTIQFELIDFLEDQFITTPKRGKELLHEWLCLGIHEGSTHAMDKLQGAVIDIKVVKTRR